MTMTMTDIWIFVLARVRWSCHASGRYGTQVGGSIPTELAQLATDELNHVILNQNKLTGPIPKELFSADTIML